MWLNEADVYSTEASTVKMLIGNKIDMPREVSTEEGLACAREHNMLFIEAR